MTTQKRDRRLAQGSAVMALAALGFVGYGLLFFIRNFSRSFLELGIGPNEVRSSREQIEAFDKDLFHYIQHLQIALSASSWPPASPSPHWRGSACAAACSGRM